MNRYALQSGMIVDNYTHHIIAHWPFGHERENHEKEVLELIANANRGVKKDVEERYSSIPLLDRTLEEIEARIGNLEKKTRNIPLP